MCLQSFTFAFGHTSFHDLIYYLLIIRIGQLNLQACLPFAPAEQRMLVDIYLWKLGVLDNLESPIHIVAERVDGQRHEEMRNIIAR